MPQHQHEDWQLLESAKGGRYCGACGEHVAPGATAEERAWNQAHGLTAQCAKCGGAMKDDGRRFCSFACYHRAREDGDPL